MCKIAIDFDGTISHDFEAARAAISTLIDKGHYIIIWSSRNNPRQHPDNQQELYAEMKTLLESHNIPYNEIDDGTCGKFHAQVYIDDKAWRFENNWDEIVERIY